MRKQWMIWCVLFFAGTAGAQPLNLLPLPVHTEQTHSDETYSIATKIIYKGLDSAAIKRLNWHWENFRKEIPSQKNTRTITLVLLDRNKTDQHFFNALPAQWRDSIGTEGYVLLLSHQQQVIVAYTETGLFYGLQTIRQLSNKTLTTTIRIADWPSFAHRAVYDDISRGPISTVAYVKKQIERLAGLKINYLSFYIEHVVQPLSYPDFAPSDGKFTIADIKELSAYAEKFHMQLIGSFQSFGHFEKILSLPRYRSMGETVNMISPLDPDARKFLSSVIGELCDAFSAPYFNVNCDETFDLGKGKSKSYTDSVGVTKFYADHIKFLYDIVKSHHKQLMMWGDIALEHEEMLDMLPKDIIYLTWEYGSQASFDKWIVPFQKRGLPFIVCPGILNSNRMFPDMVMASANIDGFLAAGKQKGALGVLTTVWDDGGAFLFSGDWYGVYKAADKSWNVFNNDAKSSFDAKFNSTAYGTNDDRYTRALDSLMELRKLTLTFNLNENVWHQKLIPAAGRKLIINNADTDTALRILTHAKSIIETAKPRKNTPDIQALAFSIDQYILMMDTRRAMVTVADLYAKATATDNITVKNKLLQTAIANIRSLASRHLQLAQRFTTGWLRENQQYSLTIALQPFEEKLSDLKKIETNLATAITALAAKKTLPSPTAMQLSITASSDTYFQNWLFGGPFPLEKGNGSPSFLYSGDSPEEKMPKPGDLISFHGKPYRWQKYASPNGGIIEPSDFYADAKNGAVYAFCTITTDKKINIPSFTSAETGVELFCNGKKIFSNGKTDQPANREEQSVLPLQAGINYVLLKLPSTAGNWSFSFRLAPGYAVTNQKHKYFLNTEKGNHEAE